MAEAAELLECSFCHKFRYWRPGDRCGYRYTFGVQSDWNGCSGLLFKHSVILSEPEPSPDHPVDHDTDLDLPSYGKGVLDAVRVLAIVAIPILADLLRAQPAAPPPWRTCVSCGRPLTGSRATRRRTTTCGRAACATTRRRKRARP